MGAIRDLILTPVTKSNSFLEIFALYEFQVATLAVSLAKLVDRYVTNFEIEIRGCLLSIQ